MSSRSARGAVARRVHFAWSVLLCVLAGGAAGCGGDESAEPEKSSGSGSGSGSGGGSGEGGAGGALPELPESFPATQPCTTFPQSGCPDGHTCVVAASDGSTMCQNAGSSPRGGGCGHQYDCAVGLRCVGDTCRDHCHVADDCPGPTPACFQLYREDQPTPNDFSCNMPCNPADPQNGSGLPELLACPGGQRCDVLDTSLYPVGSTDCFEAGDTGPGGACESGNECAPGLTCLSDGSSASCQPLCLMGITGCNCLPFAEPFYSGTASGVVEVGYCG